VVKQVGGVVAPDQPSSQTLGAFDGMTTSGTVFLADTSLHRSPQSAIAGHREVAPAQPT
jgi:hypothetical protein